MKPYVDRELCMGCKACAIHCPDIFKIDSQGLSEVIFQGDNITGTALKCAQQAEEACPTGAIRAQKAVNLMDDHSRGV